MASEKSLKESDHRAIDAASELGCERILLAAFDKLLSQLAAMKADLCSREWPYATGILEQANSIKSRWVAMRKHIEMKNSYKELCTSSTTESLPFEELKNLYHRTARLFEAMRFAADQGESAAQDAFRKAEDELTALHAIAREQHAIVLASIRQTLEGLVEEGQRKGDQPEKFCSELEAPYCVVSIDMVAYSAHSRLQESGPWPDPEAVLRLNRRIRTLIDQALADAHANLAHVWRMNTGDGEILIFTEPLAAVKFALAFAERAKVSEHEPEGSRRIFRTGVASGNACIVIWRNALGRIVDMETGGTAIAEAVRIQSACAPNGIMICSKTFNLVRSAGPARNFPHRQRVRGKPHERLDLLVHSTTDHHGYLGRLWRALLNR